MATIDDFINKMKTQLGKPYVWGGDSPSVGFDCSGLIYWALGQFSIGYPRTSDAIINAARQISVSEALKTKGALLYFPGHIVVSLGNGQIIEAPSPGGYVRIVSEYGGWTRGGIIPELTNTPVKPTQPKETKVKAFTVRDAKADAKTRTVSPDKHFYICRDLNSADFNATDVVGGAGKYDITVQLAVEGTPGDVIGVRYILKEGKTGKELAAGPWDDTTIPARGYIATTSNFKRSVTDGAVVYIQVKSSAVAKGNIKVTNLISDAFLFLTA